MQCSLGRVVCNSSPNSGLADRVAVGSVSVDFNAFDTGYSLRSIFDEVHRMCFQ